MPTMMKITAILLLWMIWLVPALLTQLDIPFSQKRLASLVSLTTGFLALSAIAWQHSSSTVDFIVFLAVISFYCGIGVVFTFGYMRSIPKLNRQRG
jgi:hypothetical protein